MLLQDFSFTYTLSREVKEQFSNSQPGEYIINLQKHLGQLTISNTLIDFICFFFFNTRSLSKFVFWKNNSARSVLLIPTETVCRSAGDTWKKGPRGLESISLFNELGKPPSKFANYRLRICFISPSSTSETRRIEIEKIRPYETNIA